MADTEEDFQKADELVRKANAPDPSLFENNVQPTAQQVQSPMQQSMQQPMQQAAALQTSPLNNSQFAQAQLQSLEQRKNINQNLGDAQAAGFSQEADVKQKAAEDFQKQQEASQLALAKAMKDADARDAALRAKIAAANAEKIDPERYWNSRSTGGKILAGIGIILGGMGQGLMRRGENPAMQVINKAIDDDIAAQKGHIENSWKAISQQHELDDNSLNRELHKQTWENHYRNGALEHTKLQLEGIAAKTQSDVVKQNALIGMQDISDQQLKIRNQQYLLGAQAALAGQAKMEQLSKRYTDKVTEIAKEKNVDTAEAEQFAAELPEFRPLFANGNLPPSVMMKKQLQQEAALEALKLQQPQPASPEEQEKAGTSFTKPGMSPEEAMKTVLSNPKYAGLAKMGGVLVPDVEGQARRQEKEDALTVNFGDETKKAPTVKDAEQWTSTISSYNKAIGIIDELIRERNKAGGGSFSPTKTAEMYGAAKYASASLASLESSGKISGQLIRSVQDILPKDPNAYNYWWAADPTKQLEYARKMLEDQFNSSWQAFGERKANTAGAGPAPSQGKGSTPATGNVGTSGKTYGTPVR